MSKSSNVLKPSVYKTFLVFLGITILINCVWAYYYNIPMGMSGIGLVMSYIITIIPTGIITLILGMYILYKAKQNKESKKYAIICKYALLAVMISAIILYITHNTIPSKTKIDHDAITKIHCLAFIAYLCLNTAGIIHTVIIFIKNRKKQKTA